MTTTGVEGLIMETHNWGRSVAFWQALGYTVEFETDHNSGRLRHPAGGPYLFLVEVPEGQAVRLLPALSVDDADRFEPPRSGTVEQAFEPQHWGIAEMRLRDPDGRVLSIQAPLPEDAQRPPLAGH
jgi:hypothetical protein